MLIHILKTWVKSKFALWQPRYYNLLTEKNKKNFQVFEVLTFWKRSVAVNL